MRLDRFCILVVPCIVGCTALEVRQPPAALLAPCAEPAVDATTNGGLVKSLLAMREALRLCNDDKTALREWAAE